MDSSLMSSLMVQLWPTIDYVADFMKGNCIALQLIYISWWRNPSSKFLELDIVLPIPVHPFKRLYPPCWQCRYERWTDVRWAFSARFTRHRTYYHYPAEKSCAFPDTSRPMISPKSPKTELKISMTRTLTNLERSFQYVYHCNNQCVWNNIQTRVSSIS